MGVINRKRVMYFLGNGYLIDRDLIAKSDGFKFNVHRGTGKVKGKGLEKLFKEFSFLMLSLVI